MSIQLLYSETPPLERTNGVDFADGPLLGLTSRAVVVVDPQGKVSYTQQGFRDCR